MIFNQVAKDNYNIQDFYQSTHRYSRDSMALWLECDQCDIYMESLCFPYINMDFLALKKIVID